MTPFKFGQVLIRTDDLLIIHLGFNPETKYHKFLQVLRNAVTEDYPEGHLLHGDNEMLDGTFQYWLSQMAQLYIPDKDRWWE